ncbi:glycerolphosphate mutase, putative [Trypanosoma brucei gambiense DAL972]|uniref:Glycerolphosphate mutase, putative n=1 Tax=Trypanosoma brucei gambiense (strain MHOM/CI/86/DAL972) TaxID=679716 RepID=D0A6A6_TRYB9|nr:glycerolphosphate mutase, putative [Trypanosoma brucei gambiense DAL972]CBH17207.1 glycerolphosphate mutase, putative [Trypanosoma brucei gambiense DAL972]|eukprot:XP_011779471.1 glycerolphosphate mutase, putative [Trypanosoma brucei gambiense DAL972]
MSRCGRKLDMSSGYWLPRRLLLVRHGESEANVDRALYSKVPDWKIPLTARGREQAFECGRRLRKIIKNEKLYVYYSPYTRTRQTLTEVRKSLLPSQVQGEREDERLREQEIGNFQPLDKMDEMWAERSEFGRSYYRFPDGESSVDVGDRVSKFFDSLFRERVELNYLSARKQMITGSSNDVGPASFTVPDDDDHNVVIISHGLLIRLFVGRWYSAPMEVFETMKNPPNCGIVVLERREAGRLVMTDTSKKLFGSDPLLEMMKFDGKDNVQLFRHLFAEGGYSFSADEGTDR